MTDADYEREFECSFDAAIPGAYWAKEIGKIYEQMKAHKEKLLRKELKDIGIEIL
jgi:hypothetical protein